MLEVLNPGWLSTVQDLGRTGHLAAGVPQSGALDPVALRVANRLVGNSDRAAGIEMTMTGTALLAAAPAVIAVTGADFGPRVNGAPLPMWTACPVKAGETVEFAGWRSGCRCYLAVSGGIDLPPVLGSRSADLLAGLGPPALKRGDRLPLGRGLPPEALAGRSLPPLLRPAYPWDIEVCAVLGPQDDRFSSEAPITLSTGVYKVDQRSDRAGCRLEGPRLRHTGGGEGRHGADIISDGTPLGAIQVPPDGQPIVLLQGHPTMGGYAKIGVVVSSDVGRLAQVAPGGRVRFRWVTRDEAHLIHRAAIDRLRLMLEWCR